MGIRFVISVVKPNPCVMIVVAKTKELILHVHQQGRFNSGIRLRLKLMVGHIPLLVPFQDQLGLVSFCTESLLVLQGRIRASEWSDLLFRCLFRN